MQKMSRTMPEASRWTKVVKQLGIIQGPLEILDVPILVKLHIMLSFKVRLKSLASWVTEVCFGWSHLKQGVCFIKKNIFWCHYFFEILFFTLNLTSWFGMTFK